MALDRDSWFLHTGRRLAIISAVLLGVGLANAPLQNRVWGEVKTFQPELNLADVESALGQGVVIGLLGGFRTLLADFVYLRAGYYWEHYDRANTEALLALTTAIDPRPMYFWLNSARMIAYDIPIWRIKEREKATGETAPQAYKDLVFQEQVERAMMILDRAEKFHPNDVKIPLEKARIYFDKVNDYENAAKYYREAIKYPDVPYYAARVYANALDKLGRTREAYDFLRYELYPTLPPSEEVPQANREVVLNRIREFEEDLDLSLMERFPPQDIEAPAEESFIETPYNNSGDGTYAPEN